jgi:hypothetical protein
MNITAVSIARVRVFTSRALNLLYTRVATLYSKLSVTF